MKTCERGGKERGTYNPIVEREKVLFLDHPLFSERPGHLIQLARQAVEGGAGLVVAVRRRRDVERGRKRIAGQRPSSSRRFPWHRDGLRGRTAFDEVRGSRSVALGEAHRERSTPDAFRYRTWSRTDAERGLRERRLGRQSGAVAQRANGMSKALGGRATFFYALTRVFFEWTTRR